MKAFVLAISLFSSLSFAADKVVEAGLYSAVDVDSQTIVSSLEIHEDKTVIFNLNTPDFTMPAPGCQGTYTVVENTLTANMTCPLDFLPEVVVTIDVTNVTPESVRSADGVIVDVKIDALGEDSYKFILKKIEQAPAK